MDLAPPCSTASRRSTTLDEAALRSRRNELVQRFATLEATLGAGPYFSGEHFSIVDAVFAPVFRYFESLSASPTSFFEATPRLRNWRAALAARRAGAAVAADYDERLLVFLESRGPALSRDMRRARMHSAALQICIQPEGPNDNSTEKPRSPPAPAGAGARHAHGPPGQPASGRDPTPS